MLDESVIKTPGRRRVLSKAPTVNVDDVWSSGSAAERCDDRLASKRRVGRRVDMNHVKASANQEHRDFGDSDRRLSEFVAGRAVAVSVDLDKLEALPKRRGAEHGDDRTHTTRASRARANFGENRA